MTLDAEPWRWQPNLCPADQDLIEWLTLIPKDRHWVGPLFHMGPGEHHRVGRYVVEKGLACLAVTVSEGEYLMKPDLGYGYTVLVQNLWDLPIDSLPMFQFMTLFHLGEESSKYGEIDYMKLDALVGHVKTGGRILFYNGSAAWDKVIPYIQHAGYHRGLHLFRHEGLYKNLEVYRKL